jgi:hypothetical protein
MALDGSSTNGMSSSSSPTSSSTFLRFVGGRLGEELPDQGRLRLSFGTVREHKCCEQNDVLPKGSRSVVETFSDSEGRVSHSFMV